MTLSPTTIVNLTIFFFDMSLYEYTGHFNGGTKLTNLNIAQNGSLTNENYLSTFGDSILKLKTYFSSLNYDDNLRIFTF